MTTIQELAAKAVQGAQMTADDIHELYKFMCKENPVGSFAILRLFGYAQRLATELKQIENLLSEMR